MSWRPCLSWPAYEANENGEIRHVSRKRPRKFLVDDEGYLIVTLWVDGRHVRIKAHRMVAEAFHGACPQDRRDVAHRNGNPGDNRPDNLRWTDPFGNAQDKIRHGRQPRGDSHPRRTLCSADVRDIRTRHARGETLAALGREFGVSYVAIRFAVQRQTWAHVE